MHSLPNFSQRDNHEHPDILSHSGVRPMRINKNDCYTLSRLVQMVSFLNYVEQVPSFSLSQDTDSPDGTFSLFSIVPPNKYWNITSGHDHFSLHL
jgi:hypothetical protein